MLKIDNLIKTLSQCKDKFILPMNFKKYLKLPIRKFGFLRWGGLPKVGLLHYLIPAIITVGVVGTVATQVPSIHLLAARFTKPKAITQSSTYLSANIQSAIQSLASQEIKAEQANANLTIVSLNTNPSTSGLIQPLIDTVQEVLTLNPSEKAKIKLKIIDKIGRAHV